jgi:hypothetical protein
MWRGTGRKAGMVMAWQVWVGCGAACPGQAWWAEFWLALLRYGMAKIYRPHIPIKTRCAVALKMLGEIWIDEALEANKGALGSFLDRLLKKLSELLAEEKLHLDHDPALATRKRRGEGKKTIYDPSANDPYYLVYRGKHAHHIKTNVKGDGAQHPDRVLIRRERRRQKRERHPPEVVASRRFKQKRKWPKRSFPKRRER